MGFQSPLFSPQQWKTISLLATLPMNLHTLTTTIGPTSGTRQMYSQMLFNYSSQILLCSSALLYNRKNLRNLMERCKQDYRKYPPHLLQFRSIKPVDVQTSQAVLLKGVTPNPQQIFENMLSQASSTCQSFSYLATLLPSKIVFKIPMQIIAAKPPHLVSIV